MVIVIKVLLLPLLMESTVVHSSGVMRSCGGIFKHSLLHSYFRLLYIPCLACFVLQWLLGW